MTAELRQVLALLAAQSAGAKVQRIFDQQGGAWSEFDARELAAWVAGERRSASIYDFRRSGFLTIDGSRFRAQIYDASTGTWLDAQFHGAHIEAYDSSSGSFVHGEIRTDSVSLFDSAVGSWFDYQF